MSLPLLIIGASIVTGAVVGWWLTQVIATAAMSRSQEHMEKRVRFWQAQARLGHEDDEWAEPERLSPDYWPDALAGTRGWPQYGYEPSES